MKTKKENKSLCGDYHPKQTKKCVCDSSKTTYDIRGSRSLVSVF